MTGRPHHLDLEDRGIEHRRRWTARCDCGCGWTGTHRRRKGDAVLQYRQMVEGSRAGRRDREAAGGGRTNRKPPAGPRPVTPTDRLPDALR